MLSTCSAAKKPMFGWTLAMLPLLAILTACSSDRPKNDIVRFDVTSRDVTHPPLKTSATCWGLSDDMIYAVGRDNGASEKVSTRGYCLPLNSESWTEADLEWPDGLDDPVVYQTQHGCLLTGADANDVGLLAYAIKPVRDGFNVQVLPAWPRGYDIQAVAFGSDAVFIAARRQNERHAQLFQFTSGSGGDEGTWNNLGELPIEGDAVEDMVVHEGGARRELYVISADLAHDDTFMLTGYDFGQEQWMSTHEMPEGGVPEVALPGGLNSIIFFRTERNGGDGQVDSYNCLTGSWSTPFRVGGQGRPLAGEMNAETWSTLWLKPTGGLELRQMHYARNTNALHLLDYIIICLFFCGLILFSLSHSAKTKTADGYFRGGRNVHWMAAGLSIVATRLSSTSFVSIPAKSFATNWQYSLVPFTNLVGAFIMTRWFLRFFIRLDITSGYEYLEKRFCGVVRTIGSLNYLAYELARIGLLILVPAVALAAVAKLDLSATILVMGLIATAYTFLGGIEGVIWADAFQIGVKVAGLIIAVVSAFLLLDGSPAELAATAWDEGKLNLVDWSWDFSRDTIWVFMLFWLTDGLKSYVANQTVIQRFISTKDEKTAKRTVWTSAIVGTLITWLLLLIGTALFLFYQQNPDRYDVVMDKPDGIFPWFIVYELPAGFVGILIAALSAAAMSSLDGALNSTSTVLVTDFYRRFHKHSTDAKALRLGKILTLMVGFLATLLALMMASMADQSLFDLTLKIIGLFGGGLGGMFLLGMLTTRTSSTSVLLGFVSSAMMQYYVVRYTDLNFLAYMFTGMSTCFVVGYLAGILFPERKSLAGLTVHTVDSSKTVER